MATSALEFSKKNIYKKNISLQNLQFPVRIFVDCEQIVEVKRKMFSDCEVLAVNKKPLEPGDEVCQTNMGENTAHFRFQVTSL